MKIINGVRIAISNKSLWFKTLLAKTIVVIAFIVSLYFMANIIIEPILKSAELKSVIDAVRKIVSDFILFNDSNSEANAVLIKDTTTALITYIQSMLANIIWVGVGIVVFLQVVKFIFSMFDYVIGVNVNEHMSSMLHAGFFSTLFENFKMASKYALFRTLLMFVYDLVVTGLMSLLFFSFMKLLGIYSLSLLVLVLFMAIALRLTVTGLVLPVMICENKGPIEAFKVSLKYMRLQDSFNRFLSYLISAFVVYVVVIVSSIVTFNVAFVLAVPLCGIIFKSLRFVDYYTLTCKKYYMTFDDIVIPKELRQNDEQLLNKIDI